MMANEVLTGAAEKSHCIFPHTHMFGPGTATVLLLVLLCMVTISPLWLIKVTREGSHYRPLARVDGNEEHTLTARGDAKLQLRNTRYSIILVSIAATNEVTLTSCLLV